MMDLTIKEGTKLDIVIEVKTLCRKAKTTTWAQLVESGFKIGENDWGPADTAISSSAVGSARMGLLASFMNDSNKVMTPAFAKAVLPEMTGLANGLGQISFVGHKEGADKPEPILTILFEFSQKPGDRIKVSKNIQDYFNREEEIKKDTSLLLVRDLFYALESYKGKNNGIIPRMLFDETEEVPAYMRGRRFSPDLTRIQFESKIKPSVVINIREHTTEPAGICPPILFQLIAEEADDGVLWLRYEGSDEPTAEQNLIVKEVMFAYRDLIYGGEEGSPTTHDTVQH
jgi:hypothetical protein